MWPTRYIRPLFYFLYIVGWYPEAEVPPLLFNIPDLPYEAHRPLNIAIRRDHAIWSPDEPQNKGNEDNDQVPTEDPTEADVGQPANDATENGHDAEEEDPPLDDNFSANLRNIASCTWYHFTFKYMYLYTRADWQIFQVSFDILGQYASTSKMVSDYTYQEDTSERIAPILAKSAQNPLQLVSMQISLNAPTRDHHIGEDYSWFQRTIKRHDSSHTFQI